MLNVHFQNFKVPQSQECFFSILCTWFLRKVVILCKRLWIKYSKLLFSNRILSILDSRGWETTQDPTTPASRWCRAGTRGRGRGHGGQATEFRGPPQCGGNKGPLASKVRSFPPVWGRSWAKLGGHHIIALWIISSLYSRAFHDAWGHRVKIMDNVSRFYWIGSK
jgi:hypothetical protein